VLCKVQRECNRQLGQLRSLLQERAGPGESPNAATEGAAERARGQAAPHPAAAQEAAAARPEAEGSAGRVGSVAEAGRGGGSSAQVREMAEEIDRYGCRCLFVSIRVIHDTYKRERYQWLCLIRVLFLSIRVIHDTYKRVTRERYQWVHLIPINYLIPINNISVALLNTCLIPVRSCT